MTDPATTLFLLRIVKLVIEIAALALAGQGLVYVLTRAVGADPARNVFYKALEVIASPVVKLARWVTPRVVSGRHVPLAALGLLVVGYFAVLFGIANTCVGMNLPVRECLARPG